MLHEPASKSGPDPASPYKTKLGIQLFVVYCFVYALFVGIITFSGPVMEKVVAFGLNLALVYGFGLIILALIMAVIYNAMCTRKEAELSGKDEEETK